MAKVTGPLHSTTASGAINQSLVYGRWKGKPWVRAWRKPVNPQSPEQQAIRSFMAKCVQGWGALTDIKRGQWDDYALANPQIDPITGLPADWSGFNAYTSVCMVKWLIGHEPAAMDPAIPTVPPPAITDGGDPNTWTVDVAADDSYYKQTWTWICSHPRPTSFHYLFYIQRYLGMGQKPDWRKANLDGVAPCANATHVCGQLSPGERIAVWIRAAEYSGARGRISTVYLLGIYIMPAPP